MPFTGKIGTDWGGEYSNWNFDESKMYMLVAKMFREPGTLVNIPLLDFELNEQGEIFLQLLRRFIQRIFGNGTTNNGFKIVESGTSNVNNFTITGGDGTPAGAGFMFVKGWMPIIPSSIEYTDQSGAATLTTPAGSRTDEVYLDVYYDEVDSSEDSDMKDTTINLETSRRIALRWEVKVAENGTTPGDYVDGNNIQHVTCHIATLNRLMSSIIDSSMIVDERVVSPTLIDHVADIDGGGTLVGPHGARWQNIAEAIVRRDTSGDIRCRYVRAEGEGPPLNPINYICAQVEIGESASHNNTIFPMPLQDIRDRLYGGFTGMIFVCSISTVPAGFLECDGSAVSRTTYAALFAAIGTTYGIGDGSTTFNLPDLRGEFIRGWSHGTVHDPDRLSRTDRGDGTTGDNVGTKQMSQNKTHSHTVNEYYELLAGLSGAGVGWANTSSVSTGASGGDEARPRNVNVMFLICYF